MSPPETSNPITVDSEKYNIAEAQDKDFKITIMNIVKDFNEGMNKSLSELNENTKS